MIQVLAESEKRSARITLADSSLVADYWNHNTAYHPWLLDIAAHHHGDVLDVGCGERSSAEASTADTACTGETINAAASRRLIPLPQRRELKSP